MGIDLSPIFYAALAVELIVGLICVVAAYLLLRPICRRFKAHMGLLHPKRLHMGFRGTRGFSHQAGKA